MSKAQERAFEAYPEDIQLFVESQEEPGKWLPVDENIQFRHGYKQGYEAAEKDLALTWEDMKTIEQIITTSDWYDFEINGKLWSQEFYEEVLKRFKEKRNDQD